MNEIIERVAKALAGDEWNNANDRDRFLRDARDAIKAMRDPSAEMLALSKKMAGNELSWDADAECLARVYRAMIDVALQHCP
jgi:hypothetical protein